jgi:hypothetical protein
MATPQDSMLAGLFTTPEQYQQQRQAVQRAQAIQMAQLDPFQQGQANIQMGINRIADVGAGALGIQDPQLQAVSTIRELSSKYDTNTSGGVAGLATELQQRGMQQQAFQLGQRALEMRKLEAEAQAKTMEKLTNEQKNATAIADSSGATRGTPEWTDKYNTELARLTAGSKGANIKEIGVAEKTREPVYFDVATDSQFVVKQDPRDPTKQVRVPFNGGVDRTTAKTDVKVDNKAATAGSIKSAELDAKRLADAQTAADKAIEAAGILNQLEKTPQGISGAGADARVAALRVFDSLGLTSSTDQAALSNADKFNSLTGERTLSFIKQLGTNPTDTDREFAKTIGPAIQKGEKTNKDIIAYLRKRAQEIVGSARAMEQHYYKNDYSLRGYESPFIKNIETPSLTNMSADDLAKAAGGRIVNGKFVKN